MFASNLRLVCERLHLSCSPGSGPRPASHVSELRQFQSGFPGQHARHYHFIASSPCAITEQSAASRLRLLGPLRYLPGHGLCRGRPGEAQVGHRCPPSAVGVLRATGPAEGQRSCNPSRRPMPQGQRSRTVPWNPVWSVSQPLALG